MRHRDTYFVVASGRLKLRQWWQDHSACTVGSSTAGADTTIAEDLTVGSTGAQLIAYSRPDDAGTRRSDYVVAPCQAAELTIAAIARACGIAVVVEKRRVLYWYGATRIHFDTVERLGHFIELETVLSAEGVVAPPEARAEHAAVRAFLALEQFEPVGGSYSDLLGMGGADAEKHVIDMV